MAQNRERYVSGPRELVEVPIAAATVIYKGDLVYFDGGYAVGGSDLGDAGDAAANRENGADLFIGIAETAHAATDPAGKIVVDVSNEAIFQLELQAAASLSFAAALEPYADATAPSEYQLVAGTTSKIAVTVEAITSGTDIKAKLLPQVRLHRANPQT
jgi:hypothetical protein